MATLGTNYYTPVLDGGLAGGWLVHFDICYPDGQRTHRVHLVMHEREAKDFLAQVRLMSAEELDLLACMKIYS